MDGFLLIDKPAGPTSHDIVVGVRRQLQVQRVGHAGTLDPFATGLLIVLVNRATRLVNYLSALQKEYEGVIRLGQCTTTDDRTGVVTASNDSWKTFDLGTVQAAMHAFVGKQQQLPPTYSAKKIGGQPAHRRVRRGEDVKLTAQDVTILHFDVLDLSAADVRFTASVSTGTYIRSLARDLGERLGCGGHLVELRRTAIGPFRVEDALPPEAVTWDSVTPPGTLVDHLPRVVVSEDDRMALAQGRRIAWHRVEDAELTAVFASDRLVAIAEARDGYLHPKVVLN